jgi:uncharacterized protein YukJ
MPVASYGVWKGHVVPWNWDPQHASPDHALLTLTAGHNVAISAAVNVASRSRDSRLVYWIDREHGPPQCDRLSHLNFGFHAIDGEEELALDYLRMGLVAVKTILPHDSPGSENLDIVDDLNQLVSRAAAQDAIIYVFGSRSPEGIHDIHMNQGSIGPFKMDNGISQDGAMFFYFPDGHWESVYIGFSSQSSRTDDKGQTIGPTLEECIAIQADSKDLDDKTTGDVLNSQDNIPDDSTVLCEKTEICRSLFAQAQQIPALCEGDLMDDMSAKFNWWSLVIGAAKRGHSSLDYRTHRRKDVRDAIADILDGLAVSISNCVKIGMPITLFPINLSRRNISNQLV